MTGVLSGQPATGLAEIAAEYGTPAYVYDLARVRAAHADLRAMLPSAAGLYYSLKANPHPVLVGALARCGARAEVCSHGEVRTACASGMAIEDMLLTGPGKTPDLIGYALDHGVRRVSVDSPGDLARVGDVAAHRGVDVECLLRVNGDAPVPGMGLTMTGTPSQFGADASWVARRPDLFRAAARARVVGLHLYMGTNLTEQEALLREFAAAAALAAHLGPALGGLTEVDLGGGFGAPYARAGERPLWTGLRKGLESLLDRHLPRWRAGEPRITFESGRYLVGDSGTLVCRVLDVKTSKDELFAVLDAGVNALGGMVGLRRLPPILPTVEAIPAAEPRSAPRTTVVGPLCTPLDTFVRRAELPELTPGQLVRVRNVGAYGLTASLLAFLSHPAPAEVVVDDGVPLDVSHLTLTRTSGHAAGEQNTEER